MKLLKTIQLNPDLTPVDIEKFKIRKASRAVVFDQDKNIGLLYVAKHNYHKLPGGGIDEGENKLEALERECMEEIGCKINVRSELGEIKEYRDELNLTQYSYCYIADVVGEKGNPNFEQGEIDDGFEIKWMPLSEAIELTGKERPTDYEGKYIQIRDNLFLLEANEINTI